MNHFPSPHQVKLQFPAGPFPAYARKIAKQCLQGVDSRLVAIVGPCSLHDPKSALEYAKRLKELSIELSDSLFLIMRTFIEKPRTKIGWKGLAYNPHLEKIDNIEEGLLIARELLAEITKLSLPIAMEFLDPTISFYFDDLITWGIIGARTCHSQPHRLMASRLPFPIGFKNDLSGSIASAIDSACASQISHQFLGVNDNGTISSITSLGNPFTHIILRGSANGPNCDPISVAYALQQLQANNLSPSLFIDCSHGNSDKNLKKQEEAFLSSIEQAKLQKGIRGVMLESYLMGGAQSPNHSSYPYGMSITDPCLSWEKTEELLRGARRSPTSMSFVHS